MGRRKGGERTPVPPGGHSSGQTLAALGATVGDHLASSTVAMRERKPWRACERACSVDKCVSRVFSSKYRVAVHSDPASEVNGDRRFFCFRRYFRASPLAPAAFRWRFLARPPGGAAMRRHLQGNWDVFGLSIRKANERTGKDGKHGRQALDRYCVIGAGSGGLSVAAGLRGWAPGLFCLKNTKWAAIALITAACRQKPDRGVPCRSGRPGSRGFLGGRPHRPNRSRSGLRSCEISDTRHRTDGPVERFEGLGVRVIPEAGRSRRPTRSKRPPATGSRPGGSLSPPGPRPSRRPSKGWRTRPI